MTHNQQFNPFLQWVGNKSWLLPFIDNYVPPNFKKDHFIPRYIEPFVGSGSFLFYLLQNYTIDEISIGDKNNELILVYNVIKENPKQLLKNLGTIQHMYNNTHDRKEMYNTVKKEYNNTRKHLNYNKITEDSIKHASQLIFMNNTCYNGSYTMNKRHGYIGDYTPTNAIFFTKKKNIKGITNYSIK